MTIVDMATVEFLIITLVDCFLIAYALATFASITLVAFVRLVIEVVNLRFVLFGFQILFFYFLILVNVFYICV